MIRAASRRQFIARLSTGTACLALGSFATTTITAAETVPVSGRFVDYQSEPVSLGTVFVNGSGYADRIELNDDGTFSKELRQNSDLDVTYNKYEGPGRFATVLDGVPHMIETGQYAVGSEATDWGTIELRQAYKVDIRVLDENGEPIEGAWPKVSVGNTHGGPYLGTNGDGYVQIEGADFTGMEFSGEVSFEMQIPEGYSKRIVEKQVFVDEPLYVQFHLGEGVTVEAQEGGVRSTPAADDGGDGGGEDGSLGSADGADTAQASGETNPDVDEPANPEGGDTGNADVDDGASEGPQRGFFSNGEGASDFGGLSDPFVLTVGGFVLSVAGIIHNMISGG